MGSWAEAMSSRLKPDSEVIPHLVESYLAEGYALEDAVKGAASRLKGAHAVVVLAKGRPIGC